MSNRVAVVGAGLVGVLTAIALARGGFDVALVDARPLDRPKSGDGRASAIAAASRRMLEGLGLWAGLEGAAQPVTRMELTDGAEPDPARPRLLVFDGPLATGEPFAHIVPNEVLDVLLIEAAEEAGIALLGGRRLDGVAFGGPSAQLALSGGERLDCALVVGADGVNSPVREAAGIGTVEMSLSQWALSTTISHERPHGGRAEQHFYPGGPLALLPLKGGRSSIVWTERPEAVRRLAALDAEDFAEELRLRIGWTYGRIEVAAPRHAFPLAFRLARAYIGERVALVGDAAHSIHPLAGQGLNLGLKDVAALAETLVDARRLGADIGSHAVLRRYERWRRADSLAMGIATGSLSWLFSNDLPLVGPLRRLGLGLTDRMGGLKRLFIEEAAGTRGRLPRLLRGEAL